jgi:hypothetical protein
MGLFKKKSDLISDRKRALSAEIAALESEIKRLGNQLQNREKPGAAGSNGSGSPLPAACPAPRPPETEEPIFEKVDLNRLTTKSEAVNTPDHYNELGVRKYDLPALMRRIRNHFRGPATTNPKLVSYLAAGGIQGLRPLRYEKRVARNRFIFFVIALTLTLLGVAWVFLRHR